LLLSKGRTLHLQFKILLKLNESSVSTIIKTSWLGAYLYTTDLIIWNKVLIQYKYCFKVVHCLLVDLLSIKDNVLFRGIFVVLRGDFAQILLIILYSS
jgi:hypothetical protein